MVGADFAALRRRVLQLHAAGDYATALEVVRAARPRFPEKAARTTYWTACLLARTGQEEQALRALETGSRRGLWWAPDMLEWDPDLEALRPRPQFQAIVEAGRRAQASAAARPAVEPIVRGAASDQPRAALVVLHGRGVSAEDDVDAWTIAPDVLVVAPDSTQPFDSTSGSWDDAQRAEADVRRAVDSPLTGGAGANLPVVIAGFSQGAGLAVVLAAKRQLPRLIGCIAMAPSAGWARELTGPLPSSVDGLRWVLLVGSLDPRLEDCRALSEELQAARAEVRLDVIDGLGHDYPTDFGQRLSAALDWVMDQASSRERPPVTA